MIIYQGIKVRERKITKNIKRKMQFPLSVRYVVLVAVINGRGSK